MEARRFLGELVGQLEEAGRGAPVTSAHAEELLQRYAPGRRFLDIAPVVEKTIYAVGSRPVDSIDEITEVDREARAMAREAISGLARRAAFSA